jgi:phage pi2 protein 07
MTDGWQSYLQSPRAKSLGPTKDASDQESRREQKEGKTTKNEQADPSANFTTLIKAIKDEGVAYRKEEQREDRGKKFREWVTIGVISVTFVAICWQVHEMIKVYEPIRLQAEAARLQAEAAQKSADAAARSAEAAKSQSETMTRQAETAAKQADTAAQAIIGSQRAWVGPTNASFASEPAIGKEIEILVQYQNTGREPALNFVANALPYTASLAEDADGTVTRKLSQDMESCKAIKTWQGGSVAYPSTGFTSYNFNLKTKDDLVDEAITKGEKIIFLQGCFVYRTFDVPRHSYFCFFYKQGQTKIQNLNICPIAHYAD